MTRPRSSPSSRWPPEGKCRDGRWTGLPGEYISQRGYGYYFTHRLGHSLGRTVHAAGVNMDGLETHDTRTLIPGLGFTIEPGVYLPEFGVRSEIDLHVGPQGLEVTMPVQRDVALIE